LLRKGILTLFNAYFLLLFSQITQWKKVIIRPFLCRWGKYRDGSLPFSRVKKRALTHPVAFLDSSDSAGESIFTPRDSKTAVNILFYLQIVERRGGAGDWLFRTVEIYFRFSFGSMTDVGA
jgi:hypothetical protein